MAPIIRFIGRSGSGKTTLLTKVVRMLVDEGRRVAVLKHAHHRVDLDRQGKDSFRFADAGATVVTVVSPEKVASFEAPAREPGLLELAARVGDRVDVILAEGFHGVATPYMRLMSHSGGLPGENEPGELLGIIYADPPAGGDGGLWRDDADGIVRRIVAGLDALSDGQRRLERELEEAERFHGHMCPGQVLGVRMALLGCRAVGLPEPRRSKKLITWVEIDRCGADAVQTVTGCKLGKRTLKYVDYGKLAATFLNTETGKAVRVVARSDSRARAAALYPGLENHNAQMAAYRELPDADLFTLQEVAVAVGPFDRPGKPDTRTRCSACGEEINDNRHRDGDNGPLCRACAGDAYYRIIGHTAEVEAQ